MNDAVSAEGQCLCGSVKVKAKEMNKNVGACHCGMCRNWSGGPFFAVDCGQDVDIEGQDNVGIFVSSDWAERGFCKSCGSHLFYRLRQSGQHILSAGMFARSNQDLNFDHQVFIDEKPEYYSFSNDTKNMTGAELFAMYSSDNS